MRGAVPRDMHDTLPPTGAARMNAGTRNPPNGARIDPLRIVVWVTFAAFLMVAWAGVFWLIATFF